MRLPASIDSPQLQAMLQKAVKHGPYTVSLLLVVAIAHSAAQLTWQIATPLSATPATPAAAATPRTAPQRRQETSDLSAVIDMHLFGVAQADAPVAESISAPETQLNLILRGIIASDEPSESRAIVAQGNEEQTYAIGATIQSGTLLHAVYSDRVILSRRGNLETLSLPREEEGLVNRQQPVRQTASRPRRQSAPAIDLDDDDIVALRDAIKEDPTNLTEIIRPIPVSRNGQQIGYRVYPGRQRQRFARLGLRSGDIVTSVNGAPLTDPASGVEVFANLQIDEPITLTIERNGTEQQLVLPPN
ncbi:MAG: type II secretion system protein GspC [Gammaproteobacteria bacterium]|nr:type II secretion system protein GspC [Gammaproteobacteria bacterium]